MKNALCSLVSRRAGTDACCCLLSLLFILCTHASASEPVSVEARYAFAGKAKHGAWVPVTVVITYAPSDAGKRLDGELQLVRWSAGKIPNRFRVVRSFSMGPGRKQLSLCFPFEMSKDFSRQPVMELVIRDRVSDKEVFRSEVEKANHWKFRMNLLEIAMPDDRETEPVLVVALSDKDWLTPFSVAVRDQLSHFATIPQKDAPDSWIAYEGVDLLLWHDPRPAELTPGQIRSLKQWVQQGGHLLLTFAAEKRVSDLSRIADLLPATVVGRHETKVSVWHKSGENLCFGPPEWICRPDRSWRRASAEEEKREKSVSRKFSIAQLKPGAGKVFLDGETPVAVRGSFGIGMVSMLAVDFDSWPMWASAGRWHLLGTVAGFSWEPKECENLNRSFGKTSEESVFSSRGSQSQKESDLSHCTEAYLVATPLLKPAPAVWIITFLLLYAVIIGPLDFYLIRRWRKPGLTWVTMSIYIAIFGFLAYGGAYLIRGNRTFARVFEIEDSVAGQGMKRRRRMIGVFSAGLSNSDISTGGEAYVVAEGRRGFDWPVDGEADLISPVDGTMDGLYFPNWSMRRFRADSIENGTPAIKGLLSYRGRELYGRIESAVTVHDAVLVGRHGVFQLGTLEAGESWSPEKKRKRSLLSYIAEVTTAYSMSLESRLGDDDDEVAVKPLIQWDMRYLARLSFPRLLKPWRHQSLVAATQYDTSAEYSLSLEQLWNTPRFRPLDDGALRDLSRMIWQGGLVLLARSEVTPDAPLIDGRQVETDGMKLLRVVFPPAVRADGGDVWKDDLYGKPDKKLR